MKKRFTKDHRLRKKWQFQTLFKENRRWTGNFVLIRFRVVGKKAFHPPFSFEHPPFQQNEVSQGFGTPRKRPTSPKLGVSVSTRFGKAHERNLFKRKIKEIFRLHQHNINPLFELHVSPLSGAKEASYALLENDLKDFFQLSLQEK